MFILKSFSRRTHFEYSNEEKIKFFMQNLLHNKNFRRISMSHIKEYLQWYLYSLLLFSFFKKTYLYCCKYYRWPFPLPHWLPPPHSHTASHPQAFTELLSVFMVYAYMHISLYVLATGELIHFKSNSSLYPCALKLDHVPLFWNICLKVMDHGYKYDYYRIFIYYRYRIFICT